MWVVEAIVFLMSGWAIVFWVGDLAIAFLGVVGDRVVERDD
jgi:hypothetical protein